MLACHHAKLAINIVLDATVLNYFFFFFFSKPSQQVVHSLGRLRCKPYPQWLLDFFARLRLEAPAMTHTALLQVRNLGTIIYSLVCCGWI